MMMMMMIFEKVTGGSVDACFKVLNHHSPVTDLKKYEEPYNSLCVS
jgi:hypothetical protein